MSDIFSHAGSTGPVDGPLPPVVVSVTLSAGPEEAFLGWTEHIRLWWPIAEYSVSGDGAVVDFESGELVETSEGDQMISWGSVASWQPPTSLSLSWHPGHSALTATDLHLQFSSLPSEDGGRDGTQVTLSHSGWERVPDPDAARAEYADPWPKVLDRFVRFMGGPA
ncbi:SRPBCC family protein [Arthrobacter pigmenti]